MHAYRSTKSVLLQMFYQAISNSKIKVSLHAMKVKVNIKGLCQVTANNCSSIYNLYIKL